MSFPETLGQHCRGILLMPEVSVQFSRSVMSNSLWPHESQHARPPCPSPNSGVHPDSCPSSQWCHPAILSSVIPFSSCPQSLPASESFPMSQLFTGGGQNTGVSAAASFLPSIKVFSNELVLRIKWLKYWSFSFSISLSNEYSGLISFKIDWLNLLAIQGILKSLL